MENEVKVEQVEVIEEKKKFFTKKRLIALGVGAATLIGGAVYLMTRGKDGNEVSNDSPIDVEYESTDESPVVE
jgi:hypothetical protein